MESMSQRINVKLHLYASNIQLLDLDFVFQSELMLDGVK